MQNNKYICVRLSITAALYLVDNHGTSESKYVPNIIDDCRHGESVYE